MTALPPGPETDAKLAELLGWKAWFEKRGEYSLCVTQAPGAREPWKYSQRQEPHRYTAVTCAEAVEINFFGRGFPEFSTDVSAAISAAEEAREKGLIHAWDVYSGPAHLNVGVKGHAAGIWTRGKDGIEKRAHVGDSPAHALSLALCAALER